MDAHARDATIGDLILSGQYGDFARCIFTYMTPDHFNRKLDTYGYEAVGFEQGLSRLKELAPRSGQLHVPVYSEEERLSSWDKETVWLEVFPADNAPEKRGWVLILPGGGFNRQWGFIEGQAIAARANALGYTAFVLYYRVKQDGVMRLAIEDMYAAIRLIDSRADEFSVLQGKYMVGGFSAGGSIAAAVLTENLGWRRAGVHKPSAVFLGYAPTSFEMTRRAWEAAPGGSEARAGAELVLRRVAGPDIGMAQLQAYDVIKNLSADVPPVYIMANRDDPVVPPVNSLALIDRLKAQGSPVYSRIGKTGGHSCGLGIGLEAEGWFDEAMDMFARQIAK